MTLERSDSIGAVERAAVLSAERRLERLHELTSALAQASTPADVGWAAVREGVTALGAERAALWLREGEELVLIAHHGMPAGDTDRWRRASLDEPSLVTTCVRRAAPIWMEARAEAPHDGPPPTARAFACVPLVVDRHAIGALAYRFGGEHFFADDERAFVHVLADHCAMALERARLFATERETRRTLEALVSASPAAIALVDLDCTVRFWNSAAERMFGWPAAEVIGDQLPWLSEEERAVQRARLARVAGGQMIVGEERRRRTRDGRRLDFSVWISPVRYSDGRVQCAVVAVDETERRRTEETLRRLASLGSALAASLDVSSTLAAIASTIVPEFADAVAIELVSDSGARTAAHERTAEGKGELLGDWRQRSSVEEVLRTGKPEIRGAPPAGGPGVRPTACVPLLARGKALGAIVVVREAERGSFDELEVAETQEIARRAALAIDNAILYEESLAANRAKDEFLGIVSHELRTPLNAILGWASILSRDLDSRQTVEHGLRVIERNAKVQAKLIEDILDVSRIISGKLRIDQRGVDLCAVLRASVESVKAQAEAKGIEIGVEIADAPCLALGDAERLQQVLWNLLSNALKFTPKGGHVWVRLSRQRNVFVFEVRDDGKGIEAPLLPHVFERFRQGDSSTKRAHGGLGLGLAIARHLVEAHGGSIEASSAGTGQGSMFTVRMPIPAVLSIEEMAEGSAPRLPLDAAAPPSLKGRRLLVVEDEVDARELVVVALRSAGADVMAFGSASEAYRAIAQGDAPDVLISDIGMPGEDGFELIRKVRSLPGSRGKLPAIALTAYTRPEDARQIFLAGFQVHLPKPVDAGLLTAAVANLAG